LKEEHLTYYSDTEEKLNVWSHGIGFLLSIIALILLIVKAASIKDKTYLISFIIYGSSMILLYAASTAYHYYQLPRIRKRLNILDHASIYILIAGTYTPFCLITLQGRLGWWLFAITWGIALFGVILKIFYTGRFDRISTIAYVVMGWLVIIAIKPLYSNLPLEGLYWLLCGGLSYTFGAFLYSRSNLKFNHAIFHFFVLFGSICHFLAVYFYID